MQVSRDVPLSRHTRFAIGGPAAILAATHSAETFIAALEAVRESGLDHAVIGDGTNLIVSDEGFPGVVLRFGADRILAAGTRVMADAGAPLQAVVDFAIARGLRGIETMTGIPGSTGGAIYGNAGAYGQSISERLLRVRFYDGAAVRWIDNDGCEFHYRESVFKRNKNWIIFSAELLLDAGEPAELRRKAQEILAIRNVKYPPSMKCAGSIFKNLLLAELPAEAAAAVPRAVIREGKVPSAWFLEQAGAKGLARGDIHVADYHANLVYNAGAGTAADLCALIGELKTRVRDRFGLVLEEEVQYVGFAGTSVTPAAW